LTQLVFEIALGVCAVFLHWRPLSRSSRIDCDDMSWTLVDRLTSFFVVFLSGSRN